MMDMKNEYLKEAMCLLEKAMGHKADEDEESEYEEEPEMKSEKKPVPVITAIFGKKK